MKTRFFTGLVFVLVTLTCVFSGFAYFSLLFFFIAALCLFEFSKLVMNDSSMSNKLIVVIIGLFPFILMVLYLNNHFLERDLMLYPALYFIIFTLALFFSKGHSIENMGYIAMATIYITAWKAIVFSSLFWFFVVKNYIKLNT